MSTALQALPIDEDYLHRCLQEMLAIPSPTGFTDQAVAVAEANRDVIAGIKVRVGRHASGPSGIAPLDDSSLQAISFSSPHHTIALCAAYIFSVAILPSNPSPPRFIFDAPCW